MKARKPKIAKPAITGAWQSHSPYDDETDEILRECSRLRSKFNREIRPTDVIALMKRLGWRKVEGTT